MGSKPPFLSNTTRFVTWVCPHLWVPLMWVDCIWKVMGSKPPFLSNTTWFVTWVCPHLWAPLMANLHFYEIQQHLLREFVLTFGLLLWQTSIFLKYNNICYVNLSSPLGSSYGKPPFWWNTTTFVTWICPHLWAPLMWLFFGTYPLTHNPK